MTDLMAGEIVAALLLLVGVITLIALQGKDQPGPDVGVDIVDCGMVHDCDGCDECGAPMVLTEPCPGPLVWFDVEDGGALLECNTCGYVLSTGNYNDQAHQETPLLRGAV